jgi:hypothetical protein
LIVELAEGTTGENGSCLEDLKGKFITDIREYLNTNSGKTVLGIRAY